MTEWDHPEDLEKTAEEESGPAVIAMVGMAGRFPKAEDLEAFWRNLVEGVHCVSFFTEEELKQAGVSPLVREAPNFVPARAVLEDADCFDAGFFGMSPKEAAHTDPQHRVFLECCWSALEHAGCDPSRFPGLIGVYAGADVNTYALTNLVLGREGLQSLIGNDKDYLATRVSFKLNLKGPAATIQTACSTSLVAVHMACQSLLSYQCDMALAGGVGLAFPQKAGYLYQEGGILSPDGYCRPFDADGEGTVGGDGAGVVALKRHEDALADGDTIHALILGSAVNNDGAAKVGFTAPSVEGQAEAVAMALAAAEVHPETVSYIETHGTATGLGDPVEISALQDVFAAQTDRKQFCAIGSLKSNLGHMNSAAGVGSLLKTALAIKHKWLPPSLHFKRPNPMIDFEGGPFYVAAESKPWDAAGQPRRAGVSSFGIGGTNAHVVLQEPDPAEPSGESRAWQPLLISAATPTALDAVTARLADWRQANPEASLADVAYTLATGRTPLACRRLTVCADLAEGAAALADPGRRFEADGPPKTAVVAFMFPGQGAQYAGMGRGVYETEPTFRAELDHCAELLLPKLGLDIRDLMFPAEAETEADARLSRTEFAQPVLFAFEYALARQWTAWGLQPEAMIGHSVGELVAACLAGVFSLEDGLALIAERGRLVGELPAGAMLAVSATEEETRPYADLSVAAVNAPAAHVVSGSEAAIERARRDLEKRGVPCRRLHTSHAFHSSMMDPALAAFREAVARVELSPPSIPFLSNLTGDWIDGEQACDPDYWARHLRGCVRFAAGVSALLREPDRLLIEVGPGNTLCALARKSPVWDAGRVAIASTRHPSERGSDAAVLAGALGQAALADAPVDWEAFYQDERRRRIPLPTYPFERTRYWNDPQKQLSAAFDKSDALAGKRPAVHDWLYSAGWKRKPASRPATAGATEKVAIFAGSGPLAEAVQARLSQGRRALVVRAGSRFDTAGDGEWRINPAEPDDWRALAERLRHDGAPAKIVHLWSLDTAGDGHFETAQTNGFASLMALARELGGQKLSDPIQLEIVTSGVSEVTGDEALAPYKATLLGPCRVIPQEYHRLLTRHIDVIPPEDGRQTQALAERIVAEIDAPISDMRVALRGAHRWVELFDPIPAADEPDKQAGLRPNGVYLMTGGLGGIGLALAELLAGAVQAKLALTSRKGLPPREAWDSWLETHDERNPISFKIRKVRALEAHGAEVMVLSGDVADETRMAEIVAAIQARFGRLHGAIHAAGVVDQAMLAPIHEATPEQAAIHFRPKIQGAETLARVLPPDLDFCMVFSSVATALGGLGGAAYAAANCFLDAWAAKRNREGGTPWIAVNWDAWLPSEESRLTQREAPAWARFAIAPEEGREVFSRILAAGVERCVVSTTDLKVRLEQVIRTDDAEAAERAVERDAETRHARPIQAVAYTAPRDELEEALAEIWAALLGIDKVGVHDNFFKLGGDSLVAIQLSTRLRDGFGVDISVNNLFDEPTIAALADKVRAYQALGEADLETLDAKLDMIENLSEEEVAKMLAELQE